MNAGSVSVSSSEVVTGTGLARELYDADAATLVLPSLPTLGQNTAPYTAKRPCSQADINEVKTARVQLLQEAARRANAYASATVSHIKTNALAKVDQGALQRTPNPNNADTHTVAPIVPAYLPIE